MPIYSHSRLSTFEQCKLKFKFNYIDQIKTEIEQTAEAFMGGIVHEALEKLYNDKKMGKLLPLTELIDWFEQEWDKNWNDNILIVRQGFTPTHFKEKAKYLIATYYNRFTPFDQDTTIATEQRVLISIGRHQLQGYIDRISTQGETYIIHDYKTGNSLPTTDDLKADRQLKLYALALRQLYQDCKKVRLTWHYLTFDKDLVYEPTEQELEQVSRNAVEVIQLIEAEKEFSPTTSTLCKWCEFQRICPEWKHSFETEKKDLRDFFEDDGVTLANQYVKLTETKGALDEELEAIKQKLITFAERKGVTAVFGSGVRISLRSYPRLSFPKKDDPRRDSFEATLKSIGLYQQVASPDMYELAKMMNSHEIHEELIALLEPFVTRTKDVRLSVSRR